MLWICLLSLVTSSPSHARDETTRPTMQVDFGWNGILGAGRWNPIRVDVTGGTRPVEGRIVASLQRGPAEIIRAVNRYVVTPGRTSTVHLSVAVPEIPLWYRGQDLRLEVELLDERGRVIERTRLDQDDFGEWPEMLQPDTPVVIGVGALSLDGVATRWAESSQVSTSSDEWFQPLTYRAVDGLPTQLASYEPVSALMLDGRRLAGLSDVEVEAVRLWVESGGRLMIFARTPGRDMSRWLPGDYVRIGTIDVDGEGAAVSVELLNAGRAAGWTVEKLTEAPLWVASGPAGLGWIQIVSTAPELVVADDMLEDVWLALCSGLGVATSSSTTNDMMFNMAEASLVDGMVAQLGGAPGVPIWVFVLFSAAIAILIGPVDRLLLKRLGQLHRSWMVATGWIVVFSGIAYVVPELLRSGPSRLVTASMIDVEAGHDDAWVSGAVSLFTGQAEGVQIATSEDARASWVRPLRRAYAGIDPLSLKSFTSIQLLGGMMQPMRVGVWSFQSYARSGRISMPYDVRIDSASRGGPESWSILLRPPDGTVVLDAFFVTSPEDMEQGPRYRIAFNDLQDGVMAGRVTETTRSIGWATAAAAGASVPSFDGEVSPDELRLLAGARRRSQVMEQMLATGRWAMVMLSIDQPPSGLINMDWQEQSHLTFVRIMVPLATGRGDAT
ncbi:MAG: hypothetical protein AAFX05_01240 [Planctomycetota bacterium]